MGQAEGKKKDFRELTFPDAFSEIEFWKRIDQARRIILEKQVQPSPEAKPA